MGLYGHEVTFEMIMHVVWSIAGDLPTPSSSLWHAVKTVIGHQSGYTNTADSFAVISQAHHAMLDDHADNTVVVVLATAWSAPRPRVVVATQDTQTATRKLDRILPGTAKDRRVPRHCAFAKRAASREKSRSFFVLASSPLSAAS